MNEKIKELKIGQEFKNYGALCEFMGEKSKSGDAKIAQIKNWNEWFKFKKAEKGYKLTITKIHRTKQPKIDGRGKHGNQTGNSIYAEDMDMLVLNALQKNNYIETTFSKMFTNTIKIFSSNYRSVKLQTAYQLSQKYHIKDWVINGYCNAITDKVRTAFVYSLNRLQRQNKLSYKYVYIVTHEPNGKGTVATDEEIVAIVKAENDVLEEMEITRQQLMNPKLRRKHRRKVLLILSDIGIHEFWREYHITYIESDAITDEQVTHSLKNIKQSLIVATHATLNKQSNKKKLENDKTVANKKVHYFYQHGYMIEKVLLLDSLMIDKYEYFYDEENVNYEWHQLFDMKDSNKVKHKQVVKSIVVTQNNNNNNHEDFNIDNMTWDVETGVYLPF